MAERQYSNDEITVIWKSDKCIHSTNCWKSLLRVFDPRKRPWVNMEGATSEEIMKAVDKCPSGALTYFQNGAQPEEEVRVETSVEALSNGPLMVYGTIAVKDRDGNETVRTKSTAFCRCGASKNKPFCDGMHKEIQFSDEPTQAS